MNVLLFGPPGAGKETKGKILSVAHRVPHCSIGEIIRNHQGSGTELGQQSIKCNGALLPDELVNPIMQECLLHERFRDGVFLDGYPRNLNQAEYLLTHMSAPGRQGRFEVHRVIVFETPDDVCFKRNTGRLVHAKSGRSYNLCVGPLPKKIDVDENGSFVRAYDDMTGEVLMRRKEDSPHIVRERLNEYHRVTEPVIPFLENRLGPDSVIKCNGALDVQHAVFYINCVLRAYHG